ncbi:TPA: pentapeptide repeat-containing protein [Yersinia enterocolitica]|nr:pentapeptide repeat-containing protein [Yersinia enterocolitica]
MKRRLQDQSSDNKKVYEALFNQETGLLKAFQSDEESNVFSLSGPSVLAHSPSSSGPEISSEHKIEGGDVEIKTPVKISLKEHLELNSLSLRRGPASQVAGILQAAISAGVDFVGADLSGLDLSGLDLSGLDLSRAHLEGTNLSGAILKGTILKDANLSEANLSGANLSGANLSQTILSYANLRDANLTNANLSYANLLIADLTNADLTNADLTNADLTNADLTDADLTDTVVFNIITKYAILPPKYRDMMLKASRLYWPRSR